MTPELLHKELMLDCATDKFGTTRWTNSEGQYHRSCGPAIETYCGSKEYWVNGEHIK